MKNKAGFALLEMLVVVLIIAILTAIAFPQYRVLTERSRAVEARGILKQVAAAQERYYMENDVWATQFSSLDVNIPWTGTGIESRVGKSGVAGYLSIKDQRGNEVWTILLESSWITIIRNGGDYPESGFTINLAKDSDKQVKCVTPFNTLDKSYCTKIFAPGSTGHRNDAYSPFQFYDM